jgi:hypothetical protein
MTIPFKVEFGFDSTTGNLGNSFILDDPVRGVLDNPNYVLGGILFVDVSNYVKEIQIQRGKSRDLDRFTAGRASVQLDNRSRAFDPTFEASPFYGNIVPRREIRISYGTAVVYRGIVDDWNLNYNLSNDSIAEAVATDGFTQLTNQTLTASTATAQLTGARIHAILDSADVKWPAARRNIASGQMLLGADAIAESTNALQYLQQVETSEPGELFISKAGDVTFRDRISSAPSSMNDVVLSDDPAQGILFRDCQVNYGSELLYNQVVANRIGGAIIQTDDLGSQREYGISTLTYSDLLIGDDDDVEQLAIYLTDLYATPEYRFESVNIRLESLSLTHQNKVMGLELGDVVKVIYTPNGIAPAIERWCKVIRQDIGYDYSNSETTLALGFSTLTTTPLVLDDPQFGKLDAGNVVTF